MKKKFILVLSSILLTTGLQAQVKENNNNYSVEDINNSNYLYNLQNSVFKLMDKYEESIADKKQLKQNLQNTNEQLKKTNELVKNLQLKVEALETQKLTFKASEEDKQKIKNFLNNK